MPTVSDRFRLASWAVFGVVIAAVLVASEGLASGLSMFAWTVAFCFAVYAGVVALGDVLRLVWFKQCGTPRWWVLLRVCLVVASYLGLSVVGAFNILLPLALFTLLLFFGLLAIGGISLLELDE